MTRMYGVLAFLSVLPLFVAGQVVWIHLSEGRALQTQGARQASSSVEIPAMRGPILDQAGRALAINAAQYELALDPTASGFAREGAAFYEKLAGVTGQRASGYRQKVQRRASPQYVLLERGLTEAQKEEVAAWDVPGLILTPRFARRYTYGETGAHVLGHTGADGHGLAGLELQYDGFLQGTPGRRAVKRDRRGRIKSFVGGKITEPQHGQRLVLTLDLVRQTILEEELQRGVEESGADWGTAIAMDPHTGAILGMASVPTYDPNRPAAFRSRARRNHAITDRFEPGSMFKLATAVAAIEEDVIAMSDSLETGQGWHVFHNRTMHDSHGYGTISFQETIALSSNIGTALTAQRIAPGDFYQHARALGFGQPTLIDLPGEVGGMLKKPSRWSGTSQTSMAIGYEVAVTPLQMLVAYAALANGGTVVQPHLVKERQTLTGKTLWTNKPDSIRRAFSRETARTLRPAFEQVVDSGTAKQAQIQGLRVAGKTGTARKTIGGRYQPGKYRASFVGFFPADDPAVAMIVVMDEPTSSIYGGAVAAPVFQRIATRWAGTLPEVAQRIATERALLAAADTLSEESEVPAETAPPFTPAHLTAADFAADLPDLTGQSARRAVFLLNERGLDVRVEGHGVVAEQQPAPGTPLAETERVVLRCQPDVLRLPIRQTAAHE